MFVPQSYELGQEAQVDWFEAVAKLGGEARKLQFFAMRSMGVGDAFHRAYTHATQQALLEAHEHAFAYFGGVFQTLRYDNMTSLVKKILRGQQRVETERIIAFRSHWGFQSEYCNPASGNEKGGVEGELGWFRRNWLVPVPEADESGRVERTVAGRMCWRTASRTIRGKQHDDRARPANRNATHLLPLAEEGFPIEEMLYPLIVDGKGRVKVKTNWYSAPLSPGLRVTAVVGPLSVEIEHDNKVRCAARALLRARPSDPESGTLSGCAGEEAGSHGGFDAAWSSGVQAGRWPACLDRIWREAGATSRQERRNPRDDHAGACRFRRRMGAS